MMRSPNSGGRRRSTSALLAMLAASAVLIALITENDYRSLSEPAPLSFLAVPEASWRCTSPSSAAGILATAPADATAASTRDSSAVTRFGNELKNDRAKAKILRGKGKKPNFRKDKRFRIEAQLAKNPLLGADKVFALKKMVLQKRQMDMSLCEQYFLFDPREDEYQLDDMTARDIVEDPEFIPEAQKRQVLGAPLPPFSFLDRYMRKKQSSAPGQQARRKAAAEAAMRRQDSADDMDEGSRIGQRVKQRNRKQETVDLLDIMEDFKAEYGLKGRKSTKAKVAAKAKAREMGGGKKR